MEPLLDAAGSAASALLWTDTVATATLDGARLGLVTIPVLLLTVLIAIAIDRAIGRTARILVDQLRNEE